MLTLWEILKVILPACITGIATFLVTRYNYYKNIPLDKLEIAYDRIYFPIYRLILNDEEINKVIEKSEIHLKKYSKYADRSTMIAFKFLKNNPDKKKAYKNFKDNISSVNGKLRRRLGYLEPSVFSMYTYSSPKEKRVFRIFIELLGIYLSVCFSSVINNDYFKEIMFTGFCLVLLGFIFEIMVAVSEVLLKLIRVVIEEIKIGLIELKAYMKNLKQRYQNRIWNYFETKD